MLPEILLKKRKNVEDSLRDRRLIVVREAATRSARKEKEVLVAIVRRGQGPVRDHVIVVAALENEVALVTDLAQRNVCADHIPVTVHDRNREIENHVKHVKNDVPALVPEIGARRARVDPGQDPGCLITVTVVSPRLGDVHLLEDLAFRGQSVVM